MRRLPTEKQRRYLRALADPEMLLVSGANREVRALMKRGWLESKDPDWQPPNGIRITPAGLHALADDLDLRHQQRERKQC